jgi:hypothetical protein
MAAGSLLALFDDIASLLDDVAAMTKTASAKTAGVVGDDMAVNAEQVSGVRAERELPVVWAVAKGSFKNKLILIPSALLVSNIAPWLITPTLVAGGAYLCFEGFEKVAHAIHTSPTELAAAQAHRQKAAEVIDLVAFEKEKIAGAIRTDMILSGEIVIICLGTVAAEPLVVQASVLSIIGVAMTVGVYGIVACLVKIDDVGAALVQRRNAIARTVGRIALWLAPPMMHLLTVVGTAAMFLVGGGIIAHRLPVAHEIIEGSAGIVSPSFLSWLLPAATNGVVGVAAGAVIAGALWLHRKARQNRPD